MKTIALMLGLLAACSGGSKQPSPTPPGNAGSGSDMSGGGSGAAGSGACAKDEDCGDGKRCDTCPSTCPPGTEVCATVCGAPVCVAK